MGILKTLLNGVAVAGEIAQTVEKLGAFSDEVSGDSFGHSFQLGDLFFYTKKNSFDGSNTCYAINHSSIPVNLMFLGDYTGVGMSANKISPNQKIQVSEVGNGQFSAESKFTMNYDKKINEPTNSGADNATAPVSQTYSPLTISFNNLQIGQNQMKLGAFKLSISTQQLMIMTSGVLVGYLSYLRVYNQNGTGFTVNGLIKPTSESPEMNVANNEGGDEYPYTFNIPFNDFNFQKDDVLFGDFELLLDSSGNGETFYKNISEPISESEKKYLEFIQKSK